MCSISIMKINNIKVVKKMLYQIPYPYNFLGMMNSESLYLGITVASLNNKIIYFLFHEYLNIYE